MILLLALLRGCLHLPNAILTPNCQKKRLKLPYWAVIW
jgi:hypothetical protein